MTEKLTLPAPESPTNTIFNRFSIKSSSTSDIKDEVKVRKNDDKPAVCGSHVNGMTQRPSERSSADYSVVYI